jgi:molybdenum cofactor cytidylyltransferase
MGKPKPLLDFDGETCVSLVLAACRGSRVSETMVVLGPDADRIAEEVARSGGGVTPATVKLIRNTRPENGQTSSLKTGLEGMSGSSDGFIVFPVDHPLVTGADIDSLIDRIESKPRGRTIFVATYEDRRGHPVLFGASRRGPILELGDDEPLHTYVRVREAVIDRVPVANPGVVRGINTPEEYANLLAVYRQRAGQPQGDRA